MVRAGCLEPQDMSYFETAPITSTASAQCLAPAQVVFDVLADHRRFHRLHRSDTRRHAIDQLTPGREEAEFGRLTTTLETP
jgi:hypothetical protein